MAKDTDADIAASRFVDFDIHGLIGIRLVNPTSDDALAVKKQIGGFQVPSLGREPDILIRFEKNLPLANLTYLGLEDAGYTEDGFFLLKVKKTRAKARIPFETIGGRCEIVCECGLRAVPLLIPILNLTLLRKECIPLHASAFVWEGVGVLVTGWSKGGKTEALLAFADQGAEYVGDEWVILSKDGQRMYGLPEPICVWDWHIEQLPRLQKHVKVRHKMLFSAIRTLRDLHAYLLNGQFKTSFSTRLLNEAMPALKRQLHVNIPPERIFNSELGALNASFQKLIFITSHEDPSISVEPWDCKDIARRMLHSVQYEQTPLFEYYQAFKFAFPGMKNDFLESVEELQSRLLLSALGEKEAYKVSHPYPVCLQALFEEMKPCCTRR